MGGLDGFKEVLENIGDDVMLFECFELDLNEVNLGEIYDISILRVFVISF